MCRSRHISAKRTAHPRRYSISATRREIALEVIRIAAAEPDAWSELGDSMGVWLAASLGLDRPYDVQRRSDRRALRAAVTACRAVERLDAVPEVLEQLILQLYARVHAEHPVRPRVLSAAAKIRQRSEEHRQRDFLRLRALDTSPAGRALFTRRDVGAKERLWARRVLDDRPELLATLVSLPPEVDAWRWLRQATTVRG